MNTRELVFIEETLKALLKGKSKIGKKHYSITLSRLEMIKLMLKIKKIVSTD